MSENGGADAPSGGGGGGGTAVVLRNGRSRASPAASLCTERVLAVLLVVFFLLTAFLLAALLYQHFSRAPEICLTKGCIRTAAQALASMDTSVRPCDDFYEYACGNWIRDHPIPDDSASVSNFENLSRDLAEALKQLLEEDHVDVDGVAVKKSKQFYHMCLNESAIEDAWRASFDKEMQRTGGWPSLYGPSWRRTIAIEELYAYQVATFNSDQLFKAAVQPDDKDSSSNVIVVESPHLNLFARDFYLLPEAAEERQAYRTLITEVLILLGADKTNAALDARDIVGFETHLANITEEEDAKHDIEQSYSKLTFGDLTRRFTHFNWIRFFEETFKDIISAESSGAEKKRYPPFNDQTNLVIMGIEFVEKLDIMLAQYPERTVVNYLQWCWFFKTMLADLPDPYALTVFKFYKQLNLMSSPKLRWQGCVTRVNKYLGMATSRLYVKRHFDPGAKQEVEIMIQLIMDSFLELLDTEDWISERTKALAREKVEVMEQKIGYPDYLNDGNLIDQQYERYNLLDNDYYQTKFQFMKAHQHTQLARYGQPVNRTRWVSGAAVVNAFYSPNTNEIIFPAAILQPVFYDKAFPWSMKFGGIGVVIGHEITHGFDDRGRLYDKMGNVRQWWDNATISKFKVKAQCIEDQYSSYVLPQIKMRINGKNTKGENIADNGGLKQAYRAYQQWASDNKELPLLPGVDLNHDQLFFLNYAQIWCGAMNDKEAVRKLRTSEHSPGSIRVKGPLSNSEDFAKAFNCPHDSPMNPAKKCSVW